MNFSGLYTEENFSPEGAVTIDFRELEGTNCYCSDSAVEAIREQIETYPAEGIHWIDTGDYHYLTLFWLEKIDCPFTLFLFDNHPDDQDSAFGDEILSCGNWVKYAKGLHNLTEYHHWDGTFQFRQDNILTSGRRAIENNNFPVAYISIDTDVLSREFARTDWNQGDMMLDELKSAILQISKHYRIIGADVCGGLTETKGACGQDVNINLRTASYLRDLLLNLTFV